MDYSQLLADLANTVENSLEDGGVVEKIECLREASNVEAISVSVNPNKDVLISRLRQLAAVAENLKCPLDNWPSNSKRSLSLVLGDLTMMYCTG
jgi:hypothetical protein